MKFFYISICSIILSLTAQPVLACSVCFYGDPNTLDNQALRMGIVLLLAFLIVILALFAKFFLSVKKRSKISEGQ